MGRVKKVVMTIEDMFNEEFEKFEKMLADSLEDFRRDQIIGENSDENVVAEIEMATCEGKLQAYTRVAKELLGDESLEEKYNAAVEKYVNDAMEIVGITADEMDDEDDEDEYESYFDIDEDEDAIDEKFNKAFEEYISKSNS